MFCGFPVIVATLPTLEAIATPSKYGKGFSFADFTISTTSGVKTRQIASLTRNAEKNPVSRTMAIKRPICVRTCSATHLLTSWKRPDRRI